MNQLVHQQSSFHEIPTITKPMQIITPSTGWNIKAAIVKAVTHPITMPSIIHNPIEMSRSIFK